MAEIAEKLPRQRVRAEVPVADLEVREASEGADDSVEFEGYGLRWSDEATIGYFFRFTEKFQRGAFKKTIRERGPKGNGQIKFLRQHGADTYVTAARLLDLREDAEGLWFRAKTIDTAVGRDLAVELREGVVDTLSIGFDVVQEHVDKDQDPILRTVIEARLYEISAVLWPAYASATVEAVRGLAGGELVRFLEQLEQEVREGKVLSKANRDRLEEARDRIADVLDSAGGDETPEPDSDSSSLEDESDRAATLDLELGITELEMQLDRRE